MKPWAGWGGTGWLVTTGPEFVLDLDLGKDFGEEVREIFWGAGDEGCGAST